MCNINHILENPNVLILEKPKEFCLIPKDRELFFSFYLPKEGNQLIRISNTTEYFLYRKYTLLTITFSEHPDYEKRIKKFLKSFFYSNEEISYNIVYNDGISKEYLKENKVFNEENMKVIISPQNTSIKLIFEHSEFSEYPKS